ncbi:hypothetical protein ACIQU4_39735 [Streptomyces sp. NPDC090741]
MHTTLSFTEQAETALAATRTAHVSVGVLQAAIAVASLPSRWPKTSGPRP